MSVALRKLRIVAIPLTRPHALPHIRLKPSRLTYYQFQITLPRLNHPSTTQLPGAGHDSTNVKRKGWLPEEGIVKWATNRAADTWAGFGKEKRGWKAKVYRAGERMVDRMDFEEIALKTIDVSMSPSVAHFRSESGKAPSNVSLVFPPSLLSHSEVLSELRGYAEHRIPKHRRGFYLWMLITPLTAPFKLIPIIPNLPFFFCVWRSWSHYKAYKSSQYLQSLLDHDLIVPEASESLDEVYKLYPHTTTSDPNSVSESNSSSSSEQPQQPQHTLLLAPEAVPAILSLFDVESTTASADLNRAIEQARLRVASGRADL